VLVEEVLDRFQVLALLNCGPPSNTASIGWLIYFVSGRTGNDVVTASPMVPSSGCGSHPLAARRFDPGTSLDAGEQFFSQRFMLAFGFVYRPKLWQPQTI